MLVYLLNPGTVGLQGNAENLKIGQKSLSRVAKELYIFGNFPWEHYFENFGGFQKQTKKQKQSQNT